MVFLKFMMKILIKQIYYDMLALGGSQLVCDLSKNLYILKINHWKPEWFIILSNDFIIDKFYIKYGIFRNVNLKDL